MHAHTITFTDFNGNARTKTVHFNLTEAEVTKIQLESPRGIQADMQDAIDSGDTRTLLNFLELLVHRAYGVKSEDGLEFEKSPEITRKFENSAYYSDLYMSLFQNGGETGAAFIRALLPPELVARAEAKVRDGDIPTLTPPTPVTYQPSAREVFADRSVSTPDTSQFRVPVEVPPSNQNGSPDQPLTRAEWQARQENHNI